MHIIFIVFNRIRPFLFFRINYPRVLRENSDWNRFSLMCSSSRFTLELYTQRLYVIAVGEHTSIFNDNAIIFDDNMTFFTDNLLSNSLFYVIRDWCVKRAFSVYQYRLVVRRSSEHVFPVNAHIFQICIILRR